MVNKSVPIIFIICTKGGKAQVHYLSDRRQEVEIVDGLDINTEIVDTSFR